MLRFAAGFVASAVVLFAAAALGFMGSWALVIGAVGVMAGAVIAVVALEERDLADARTVTTSS